MDESKLVDRLKSMKHYFFMDRGDWFSHFVDGAEASWAEAIDTARRAVDLTFGDSRAVDSISVVMDSANTLIFVHILDYFSRYSGSEIPILHVLR